MKPVSRWVVSFITCLVLIVSLSATVSAVNEEFVVSAGHNGNANCMVSHGNGSFSSQENLLLMGDDGLLHPMGESGTNYFSYGNGMGDFDNDGDFDYIMGDGVLKGNIFLFEKIDAGNQFAPPVAVAEWSSGVFPADLAYYSMDMAIADFNEDGKLDFVMSYYFSRDCGLYLGDGALGFPDRLLLKGAAPAQSAGADAADFNNDGHMDFVIAPYPTGKSSGEPFFVNLGVGHGNFTTLTFEGLKDDRGNYVPYFGVAAADFSGDGIVDIAAAYDDYLDIYKGNGDGTFQWLASNEYDLNLSPLDNYDFNGDGNQDLVAANYGPDAAGSTQVAVLLGKIDNDGNFYFEDPVIYDGGTSGVRYAVSAPPLELNPNKMPVAVVDPIYREVTVGEEFVFDGSLSTDDDGQIVSYEWDFGDQTTIDGAAAALSLSTAGGNTDQSQPAHIYYDVGKYTVTLKVTDDKGGTASVQAEVNVLPVAAKLQFKPYTLYMNSKDKWFWATIRLPAEYDARQIDDSSVCIVLEDGSRICAYSDYGHGFLAKLRKRFCRTKRALTVRFDRQELIQKINVPSENTILMLQGDMLFNDAWIEFEGAGIIRTLERKKKEDFFSRYWKRKLKHFFKK